MLNSLEWRISPLDILGTERAYPGLIDDLSVEAWQRKIIREQMEGKKPPEGDSAE